MAKSPAGGYGHEEAVSGVLSEQVDPVQLSWRACRVFGEPFTLSTF